MNGLLLDLRYALRVYGRRPGFILIAALTLALGIGANTAIFSITYAVLLKPLTYARPKELVSLFPDSPPDKLLAARTAREARSLAGVAAYATRDFPVSGGSGEPEVVKGAQVGPSLFRVLGVAPALGRAFLPAEERPGNDRVVILSNAFWRSRFGGDPRVLGRTVDVDGVPREVVGVMPASFQPLEPGWGLWVPLVINPNDPADYYGSFYLKMVGRLAPGATPARVSVELRALVNRVRAEQPNLITDERVAGAVAVPLHEALVGKVRSTLLVLLAAVGVVLLIACANVANLLLARAAGRRREVAVRTAMGASPARVARQVLTESLLLGVIGGVAGVGVAVVALWGVSAFLPASLPRAAEMGVSAPVLAFTLTVSVLAALLFGALPARMSTRVDVQSELKEEGAGGAQGRRGRRAGKLLVVAQVAAATVLLVAAGLLARSLGRLQSVDPGMRVDGLLTMRLDLVEARYPQPADKVAYYQRVLERVRAVPGVSAAGAVHLLPLTADNWSFPYVAQDHPAGGTGGAATALPQADFRVATPDYFRAAGIPVLQGRPFGEGDGGAGAQVGVINRTMAELLWPHADPLGKTIQMFGDGGPTFTVVGVVGDVHPERLDAPARPMMYRPLTQWPNASMYLMVRAGAPGARLFPALRAAVREAGPSVPVSQLRPMDEVVRASVASSRLTSALITAFAAVALLLALGGVYGLVSYALSLRTREFGIRMALGARRRDVFRLVLGEGVVLAAAGVVIGVAGAVAASRILRAHLFQVSALDTATFLACAAAVALAAVASCTVPAWRATRVEPVTALRHD